MKKKLLVLSARYGSGHTKIAEYVANYIKENNDSCEVKLLDITDYANRFGKIGIRAMEFVAKHRPELIFNFCYEIMDHKISSLGHNRFARRSYDNPRLRQVITDYNPDIVISSHFYCSNIITYYNDLNIINTKLYTIITDYRSHVIWTKNHEKETGFIVGNDIVKEELIKRGIDKKKIYSFGLPLNLNQIKDLDDDEVIKKRYKINNDKKTYLFFGGSSSGSMYYYDYFKAIAKMNIDKNIIFISGKNDKLKRKCDKFIKDRGIKNIKVLGYSNDVFNLMKISDLVISKPGGATVTECLEMNVPMLLVPGVGGQEKYNAKFMARKRYGIKVRGVWKFKRIISMLDNNSSITERMHERMLKLDRNESVRKINNLINKN